MEETCVAVELFTCGRGSTYLGLYVYLDQRVTCVVSRKIGIIGAIDTSTKSNHSNRTRTAAVTMVGLVGNGMLS